MANVKYKPLEPLSGWMEYELLTDKLDPPIFRCRLRTIDIYSMMEGADEDKKMKLGRATVEAVVEAVAEWDLCSNGEPIPLTAENKMAWLRPIISEPLAGREAGVLLGVAILVDASNRENFLKN